MKRDVKIERLHGDIRVPVSKSVLHRELIISFLIWNLDPSQDIKALQRILLPDENDNKDIIATKACLKALSEASGEDVIMHCNESGSTLRFMMSVAAAFMKYKGLSGRIVFKPQGRLIERPLDQLVKCLKTHGVDTRIDKDAGEIILEGSLHDGVFDIEGNISSQYISGLLMALILMPESSVRLIGDLESRGYFELTLAAMRDKAIKIEERDSVFKADSSNAVFSEELAQEGDWSSAAFLISLAALASGSDLRLCGLNEKSGQRDRIILDILRQTGVDTVFEDGVLKVVAINDKDDLELELDAKDYPDIVPYIAVLAAARTTKTVISNIERLKFKECDRVKATIDSLDLVGARAEERDGKLIVRGGFTHKKHEVFKTYNDHRMAQTACLLAACTGETIEIDNGECVDKSFPGLWELLEEKGK